MSQTKPFFIPQKEFDLINAMNLQPDKLPDLDNISLMSGDTDKKGGITLNL